MTPAFIEYLCDIIEHSINEVAIPDTIELDIDAIANGEFVYDPDPVGAAAFTRERNTEAYIEATEVARTV